MPTVDTADYTLKVAFNEMVAGVFTLASPLDGTDVLSDTGLFDGTFDDVSDDIDGSTPVQVVFGTDSLAGKTQAGNLTAYLARVDDPGFWNPNNPDSPLNAENPGFVPMRPVLYTATHDGPEISPLTISGNEVTDASRALALTLPVNATGKMCDGRTNDSSFGIRRAATNLFPQGQCDSVGSGPQKWNSSTSGVVASVDAAVAAPFSPWSVKYVFDGTVASQSAGPRSAAGQAAAAGTFACGSVWFNGVPGAAYTANMRWGQTDATSIDGASTAFNAQTGRWFTYTDPLTGRVWELVIPPAVAVAAGKTGDYVQLLVRVPSGVTRAETVHLAHAMIEKGQTVVAPYVATSGGATATHAVGRVQAPASLLNATQGWVAMRVRVGWPSATGAGTTDPEFFAWKDSALSGVRLYWSNASKRFEGTRYNGAIVVGALATPTFNAGDIVTLVFAWTATTVAVSINGGAFISAANSPAPTLAANTFDIGQSPNDLGNRVIDGDVLAFACGTGPLTNSDVAAIAALMASGDPRSSALPASAGCTMSWAANTANYRVANYEWPLFRGYIRRASWRLSTRTCELYCEDFLLWASRVKPVIASTGPTTVGAVIETLFLAVDPTCTPRCDVGKEIDDFSADGTVSVTQLISDLLAGDRGTVFVDLDGTPVYEQHDTPLARHVLATLTVTEQASDVESGIDLDDIGTRAAVSNPDTEESWTSIDETAEKRFGQGDIDEVSSGYVKFGQALADDLVYEGVNGRPPITVTVANADGDTLEQILSTPLQTVFALNDDFGGTNVPAAIVQQITHTVSTGLHECAYLMTKRPARAFSLDSALDGPDVLRY